SSPGGPCRTARRARSVPEGRPRRRRVSRTSLPCNAPASAAAAAGLDSRMPRDAWNPAQYDRFRAERQQPFFDLLGLVRPQPGMRAVDLGCGTGELTSALHRRLGARETLGLDSSDAMIARSDRHAEPGLRFERGDIADFVASEPFDLVFSNAALHWLPDHD